MKYEELVQTEKYQALLKEIPEAERPAVEEAIRKMAKDFEDKILLPLAALLQK